MRAVVPNNEWSIVKLQAVGTVNKDMPCFVVRMQIRLNVAVYFAASNRPAQAQQL